MRVGDEIYIEDDTTKYTIESITNGTTVVLTSGLVAATTGDEKITYVRNGEEAKLSGKYLEENVRMSTPYTSDSYGISPDEKPFISGKYTTISFRMKGTYSEGIGGGYVPHRSLGTTAGEQEGDCFFMFTLYFLEGSDLFGTSNELDTVVTWLNGSANVNVTTDFLKANKDVSASVADFIA
jgi:hypothetical protein